MREENPFANIEKVEEITKHSGNTEAEVTIKPTGTIKDKGAKNILVTEEAENRIMPTKGTVETDITPIKDIVETGITPIKDIVETGITPIKDIVETGITPINGIVVSVITLEEDIMVNVVMHAGKRAIKKSTRTGRMATTAIIKMATTGRAKVAVSMREILLSLRKLRYLKAMRSVMRQVLSLRESLKRPVEA
ncbi:MAG: hypothetical protein ABFQ95_00070 [Pseudomonadota bacterium]